MKQLFIIIVFCSAISNFGCRDNPPVIYPTAVNIEDEVLPLGVGDRISIVVYNSATEKAKLEFSLNTVGQIDIPYIGAVAAVGKLPQDLKADIEKALADGYLVNPIVAIAVLEVNSRKISVSGQVQKTGTIKFTPGMTIVDAIAMSGGLMPMARGNAIKVTRAVKSGSSSKNETYVIPYEMINEGKRPNFPMMPGDQVYVEQRIVF